MISKGLSCSGLLKRDDLRSSWAGDGGGKGGIVLRPTLYIKSPASVQSIIVPRILAETKIAITGFQGDIFTVVYFLILYELDADFVYSLVTSCVVRCKRWVLSMSLSITVNIDGCLVPHSVRTADIWKLFGQLINMS